VELTDYRSAVILVDVGAAPRRLFSASTLEGHVMALRGGRTLFDFTRSPIAPAFQNPAYAWDEPWRRLQLQPVLTRPQLDMDRFRYLYLHCVNRALHPVAATALEPDARLIAMRGEWSLYESRHLKFELDSPDGEMPYPRPHTLRKRMKDIIRTVQGEPNPPEIVQTPPPGWSGPALALPTENAQDDKAVEEPPR
jgi:hypothetical protein